MGNNVVKSGFSRRFYIYELSQTTKADVAGRQLCRNKTEVVLWQLLLPQTGKILFLSSVYIFAVKLQNNIQGKSLNIDLSGILTKLPVSFTHFTRYLSATIMLFLQHN
jgi:hypothetical protein